MLVCVCEPVGIAPRIAYPPPSQFTSPQPITNPYAKFVTPIDAHCLYGSW